MNERRWRLLAVASYVLVAVLAVGRALFARDTVAGTGVDLPGTIWMHWWVRTMAEQGDLPLWTDLLFYPDGKNFFNDTGANFIDAWLSIPLQWAFGVPDFLDVLDVLVLAGNALALERLARHVTGGNLPASWAAAVAFEVNPYALQQIGEGRPTQALMWFGLLAAFHLLNIRRSWRDAVLFGVFTLLQGLTYWFMIYFLVLALLPIALVQLWQDPRTVAPRLLAAMGVVGVLAAPFVVGIAREIQAGRVGRLEFESWVASPVGLPTRWRLVRTQLLQVTWLAAIAGALWTLRRSWPWLLGVALIVVFSVGPSLNATDPPLLNPPFIWMWENVPFLPRLGFPERAICFGFVGLALAAATALARGDVVWCWMVPLVAVGEASFRGALPVPATGYDFPEAVDLVKREGGPIVHLPFGSNEDAMVFQTRHGQPLFGGMGERETDLRPDGYERRLDNTFVMMLAGTLNDTHPPVGYTRADREAIASVYRWVWMDLRTHPTSWNALGYDAQGKVRRLLQELGAPAWRDEHFLLWDLRQPVADPPGLGPDAVMADEETRRVFEKQMTPPRAGDMPPPVDRLGTPEMPVATP